MTAAAVDFNLEIILAASKAALADIDRAGTHARIVVLTVNFVDREFLEQTIVQHGVRALARLFGGLEQEDGRTVKVAAFTQQLCRAEYGSGVTVMATAVHFALALALVRRIALLFQVDSVHIRTDSDRFAAVTDFQAADNTRAADSGEYLNAHLFQFVRDKCRRLYFLKCGFRMRMQLMPPLSQCFAKIRHIYRSCLYT